MRINPEQNQAASPVSALGGGTACAGPPTASLAIGSGAIWFLCEQELGRFDLRTGKGRAVGYESGISSSPSSVLPAFADVVYGLDSLWVVDRNTNTIIELDPVTIQKERPITVGKEPAAIALGSDSLWVANFGDDTVTRVEIPGPGQPATLTHIPVGDGPVDVAVGEGAVWVANSLGRSVSRIDPETNDVEASIAVGNEPRRLTTGNGRVWVTVRAPDEQAVEP